MPRTGLLVAIVLVAGCASPAVPVDDEKPGPMTASPMESTNTTVLELDIETGESVGGPGLQGHAAIGSNTLPTPFDVSRGNASRFTITAHWNTTNPAATSLYLYAFDEAEAYPQAEGPSPLTLQLPAGLPAGKYGVNVHPVTGGATIRDKVHIVIELVYDTS